MATIFFKNTCCIKLFFLCFTLAQAAKSNDNETRRHHLTQCLLIKHHPTDHLAVLPTPKPMKMEDAEFVATICKDKLPIFNAGLVLLDTFYRVEHRFLSNRFQLRDDAEI